MADETAAPIAERVEAAHAQFSRNPGGEELAQYGVVLVAMIGVIYILGRSYRSWLRMRYGYHREYLRHRKELETEEEESK